MRGNSATTSSNVKRCTYSVSSRLRLAGRSLISEAPIVLPAECVAASERFDGDVGANNRCETVWAELLGCPSSGAEREEPRGRARFIGDGEAGTSMRGSCEGDGGGEGEC